MTHQASWSPADTALRTPPHNYEAEQALLGALLLNSAVLDKVAEIVAPEHFADPAHGRIYAAIRDLSDQGQKPNPVTLKSYFERDSGLADIGGTVYLAQLANSVISTINADDYAKLVRDMADRRAIIEACMSAMGEAYDPRWEVPAKAIVEQLEGSLTDLAADASLGGKPESVSTILPRVVSTVEAVYKGERSLLGLPSGFDRLDKLISGLQPGCLYLLGGRPSMGKSVLGENIARNASALATEAGGGMVMIFSLEMTKEELGQRAMAAATEIPFHAIRNGRVTAQQMEALCLAGQDLGRLPVIIDDTPGLTVAAIRARARRVKRKNGLKLVVVDHLHLVSGNGGENRNVELATISKALKGLAKELEVPVLLLAQLNRSVEQREDKRPQLADLRESGAIEQDADVVMFVFREQYYLERAEPHRRADESDDKFNDRFSRWQHRCEEVWNTGEVIVAKQRNGPVGTVRLAFHGQYCRFANLDHDTGEDGNG
ncbi:putative Replicative DNA helicase [Magnetospirillum sp. XM-1]|uniref:replicative DNA helicase n=1 Tax=Magnetospirillum sp. XM-1 TaxID=1663591 RepID=UPI00073DFE02|nr:replicative DNA helicase [Magnetospirillum sp. XM-1]CUW39689.1 putative Replicative DNA helicase [Magnetospirillum sp. XM-1]